jgi:hypothetical protein
MLVIAGAGSGKTRTKVNRLAWLGERGVPPDSILLLTFTRKAAAQMLERASALLGSEGAALAGVQGGTFHSFAFSLLRRFPGALGRERLTVMDQSEAQAAVAAIREDLDLARGDKSFPKRAMVLSLISKARNKELPLEQILSGEAYHLVPHAAAIAKIPAGFTAYKAANGRLLRRLFGWKMLTEHEPAGVRGRRIARGWWTSTRKPSRAGRWSGSGRRGGQRQAWGDDPIHYAIPRAAVATSCASPGLRGGGLVSWREYPHQPI